MKLRPGILFSSVAHATLLAYAIVNIGSAKPFEVGPTEALPIEILSPQEFDAMTKGSKTSKKVDAPKQKAEEFAAAETDPVDDDTPVAKEEVKAAPPPPPPAAEPAKAEAPPKPDPAVVAKAEAELAEKAAKAEAEKAEKAEKTAQEKAVAEKAARAEAAKVTAAEKAEKLAAEGERLAKLEAEKVALDKAAAEKAAKAEADKAAKEKAEAEKLAKLEAEKAAKDKAEKLAKAEAEKAAKAEADKLAKAEAAKQKAEAEKAAKLAERKFDPSKIASLLGTKPSSSDSAMKDVRDPSRKAAAGRDLAPETTAGTSRGTASKLSMSQRTGIDNAVREQVMQCWNPPVGAASDGSLAVRVSFTLNADGTLSDSPKVVNSSSNPAFRAAAGAATRAVQRCAPLKLPAEAYDYWRQVNINFDPKDMMGG